MEGPSDRLVLFVGLESFGRDVEIPEAGLPDALSHLAGHTLSTVIDAELHGTRKALQEVGRPTAHLRLPDLGPAAIGAFFVAWESVTAVMGELWDIDAYNQPGVELGKRIAHRRLGRDAQ
jgi:glucose-6-phosphate isomerase